MTASISRFLMYATLGMSASAPVMALSITLPAIPTGWLNANAALKFSEDAIGTLSTANVTVTPLGTATTIAFVPGETQSYNLPITTVTAKLGFKPLVEPVLGAAMGVGLDLNRGPGKDLILANYAINFTDKVIRGDAWLNGVKTVGLPIFTFDIGAALGISLKGGLYLKEQLTHLRLTEDSANSFISALGIPKVLKGTLLDIDFGSIDIRIDPSLRKHFINGKAYVPTFPAAAPARLAFMSVSPVPEPSSGILVLFGLAGMAALAHRRKLV